MKFYSYDESSLPAGGAVEDIDGINAMMALEGLDIPVADTLEDDEFESILHGLVNKTHLP
jgi:hypothetical protein